MSGNKKKKINRYLSVLVMLMVVIPAVFITAYTGKVGVYIGSFMYMIIGMLAIWEVFTSMGFNKYVSVIPSLAIIPFFLINYNEFMHIGDKVSEFEKNIKRALTWEPYLFAFFMSFIPMLVEPSVAKNKLGYFNTQMIAIFVMFVAGTFLKGTWAMNAEGVEFVIFFILVAVFADTMGFFGGRFFGKKWFKGKKFAPYISPNKTWAGAVVGFVFSFIFAFIAGYYMHIWKSININEWAISFLMAIILSFASPIGDLTFSLIKRKIGVKDFSNLLPGHGGIFDRIDAISVVSCVGMLFILVNVF
ncbi:MAG: phosphatidate cytidylyltransferase [Mycoplasmatales bacterium]|nr:phosphatidate cytidylyltransferase [Mycoplasmatales bacterium]